MLRSDAYNPLSLPRRHLVVVGAVLATFLLLLLSSRTEHAQKWTSAVKHIAGHTSRPSSSHTGPAHLHVLIPANRQDEDLCKNVLSTIINNYGVPVLYNWGDSGAKLDKISGALPYLSSFDDTHDDDLVLIANGYDVWFQLPAQLLIDRYHTINEDADARQAGAEVGKSRSSGDRPRQTIIFAAQKKCVPGKETDLGCAAVPESPLPDNVYGKETDQLLEYDESNPDGKMRQRFLNSDLIIGPLGQTRTLLEQGRQLSQPGTQKPGSEATIFNQLFGEQEHERSSAQQNKISPRGEGNTDRAATHELGIGLDYESALSMPTVFAPEDADFITFSSPSSIDNAIKEHNISAPAAQQLDSDVSAVQAPFSIVTMTHIEPPEAHGWYSSPATKWEDVPLFTNLYTGITPAIIHHNAHRDDMVSRTATWWDSMWFQPMARDLLDARLSQPDQPLATDKHGREWWSPVSRVTVEKEGFGVQTDDGRGTRQWVAWGELCSEDHQTQLFRDGQGPYQEDRASGG